MPRANVTAQFVNVMSKLLAQRKKHLAIIAKNTAKVAEIVHEGKPFDGLVVVDEESEKPVISFDEVSDDEVVNVFIQFAGGAVFGRLPMGEDEPDLHDVGSEGIFNTHEIILRRADHRPLEKVVGA